MSYAPFKIVQTPGLIAILYELDNNYRQIYMDGRSLPKDPNPSWGGYSIGQWEGDVLVVDAAGFTDRTRLDVAGHPHSEALHIQERFHRRDFGHMDVTITIDDPVMYTKPFTVKAGEREGRRSPPEMMVVSRSAPSCREVARRSSRESRMRAWLRRCRGFELAGDLLTSGPCNAVYSTERLIRRPACVRRSLRVRQETRMLTRPSRDWRYRNSGRRR